MQETIVVEKINEAYLKLICSDSVAADISSYFTFFAPNYQFSPLFKQRRWDGKIRLYNKKNSHLYFGLFKHLQQFAQERNIELVVSRDVETHNNFSIEEAKYFATALKLTSHGKSIEVRDYQVAAFAKAIRYKRALLLSPTASGKSMIMYLISRYLLLNENKRGLIVVPTTSLVEQLYSDFSDYSRLNGWNVEKSCQRIYAKYDKIIEKSLTISTWQSLYTFDKKFFDQFDFIIGDEAHTFKASSLAKIMKNLTNAAYRIGTTGTIEDTKVHKLTLEGYFGPVSKIISTKELMDRKQLADLKIKCLQLRYSPEICSYVKNMEYFEEIDYIVTNSNRNNFISNLALSLEGNTLILFQFVDKHGKVLEKIIKEKINSDRKLFFVSGETATHERESIRAITETEQNAIIVASYGTFSTGISIRNLHNVIFASPTKSKIRSLQSIGRALRIGENKTAAVLYDIVDDLRVEDHVNYAMKHYSERVKIYHTEKFKISNYKIDLK